MPSLKMAEWKSAGSNAMSGKRLRWEGLSRSAYSSVPSVRKASDCIWTRWRPKWKCQTLLTGAVSYYLVLECLSSILNSGIPTCRKAILRVPWFLLGLLASISAFFGSDVGCRTTCAVHACPREPAPGGALNPNSRRLVEVEQCGPPFPLAVLRSKKGRPPVLSGTSEQRSTLAGLGFLFNHWHPLQHVECKALPSCVDRIFSYAKCNRTTMQQHSFVCHPWPSTELVAGPGLEQRGDSGYSTGARSNLAPPAGHTKRLHW